jgi:hypothetical protein
MTTCPNCSAAEKPIPPLNSAVRCPSCRKIRYLHDPQPVALRPRSPQAEPPRPAAAQAKMEGTSPCCQSRENHLGNGLVECQACHLVRSIATHAMENPAVAWARNEVTGLEFQVRARGLPRAERARIEARVDFLKKEFLPNG